MNAYRMWELSKGRNYFQEFLNECDCALVEIFRLIFVTSIAHPNPIPRDRHSHLASGWYTTKRRSIIAYWR
jgi:hypothetical protein